MSKQDQTPSEPSKDGQNGQLEVIDGQNGEKTRDELFISHLMDGKAIQEAGRLAGFSESYCKTGIYAKFRSKRFKDLFIELAETEHFLKLPAINHLENTALKHAVTVAEEEPELAKYELSKLKPTIEHAKKVSGLLKPDKTDGPQFIYTDARSIVLQIQDGMTGQLDDATREKLGI